MEYQERFRAWLAANNLPLDCPYEQLPKGWQWKFMNWISAIRRLAAEHERGYCPRLQVVTCHDTFTAACWEFGAIANERR